MLALTVSPRGESRKDYFRFVDVNLDTLNRQFKQMK